MNSNVNTIGCENTQLATACVPFQVMNQIFNQIEALKNGTLFPELYKPCWDVYVGQDGGSFSG